MMAMVKRLMIATGSLLALATPALAGQSTGQSGFVPMNSLPPADQLPAAPLLIAAYAFVWVAVLVYVWSIWSRLGRVEREMQALQQRSGRGSAR
jgi:CcmD family protein